MGIYTISPSIGGGGYQASNYCDDGGSKPFCLEVDWIESNGACGGATTLHTNPEKSNNPCSSWGCRAAYQYNGQPVQRMKITYGMDGSWVTERNGQRITGGDLNP